MQYLVQYESRTRGVWITETHPRIQSYACKVTATTALLACQADWPNDKWRLHSEPTK